MIVSSAAKFVFLILGVGASLEDFTRSQVANKWILAGLAAVLCCFAALGFNTILGVFKIDLMGTGGRYFFPFFYWHALIHAALAASAAMAFWYWRLWPAGDAKLYFVLSLLLVLIDYRLWGFPQFLFLTTLINIFVAAAVFVFAILCAEWAMIALSFIRRPRYEEFHALADRLIRRINDEWKKKHNYILVGWNAFAIFFLLSALPRIIPWHLKAGEATTDALAMYFMMYLFWNHLGPLLIRKETARASFFIVTLVAIPLLLLFHKGVGGILGVALKEVAGFGLFLPLVRKFIDYYLVETRKVRVAIGELKAGMILGDESWERLAVRLPAEDRFLRYADGLSNADISIIKERAAELGEDPLSISRHRPFACWIVLGCLWTLYSRQNLASWIISRIHLL